MFPRDQNGRPICARECDDGSPCYRQVQVPGAACYLHPDGEILPVPEPVPTYQTKPDSNTMITDTDSDTTEISDQTETGEEDDS